MSQTTATNNNTGTETVTIEEICRNKDCVAKVHVDDGTQWVRDEGNAFLVAEIVNEEIVVTKSSVCDVAELLDENEAELVMIAPDEEHHVWSRIDNDADNVRSIPRGMRKPEEVKGLLHSVLSKIN